MNTLTTRHDDGTTTTVVASIPTEDVVVRSSIDYTPEYVTNVYGQTDRVTKDVTLARLLQRTREEFPNHKLLSIGTPVNFDIAPTHLTRTEMQLKDRWQVEQCVKAISVSDMLIRSRVQPPWDWKTLLGDALNMILHVGWYDTVYFMQFKGIFLGDMHCRYSAKFGFDPRDARLTHFRYTDSGDLEEITAFNEKERHADSIKDKVEFLRVFRDGTVEHT